MEEKVKRILSSNLFMTLATVSSDEQPWSTPVFYALDEEYNFYWYSRKDTRHSENIKENNKVSASIFATSGDDNGIGMYVEGIVQELRGEELGHATNIYAKKASPSEDERKQLTTIEDFLGEAPLRMYRLTPSKFYISGEAKKWNGKWIDARIEIPLRELNS